MTLSRGCAGKSHCEHLHECVSVRHYSKSGNISIICLLQRQDGSLLSERETPAES